MPSHTVYQTIRYAPLMPGNLKLVEFDDHTFCILRDGHPVDTRRWKATELEDAIANYQSLRKLLAPREKDQAA